jgi:hypothetical protein
VTVTGTMPLEILVEGAAQIDGTLTANGTASVATNPNFAVGKGVAGGGDRGACGVKQGTAGANPGEGLPGKSDSNNGGGGAGGGGGGVIELTAMGGITIGASGKITANGGDSGSVIYAGGTGGAGSGGTIGLRGPTLSNGGTVQAIGGKAGAPGGGSAGGKGGDGGNGRVRFDFGMISAVSTVTPAVGYMGAYP